MVGQEGVWVQDSTMLHATLFHASAHKVRLRLVSAAVSAASSKPKRLHMRADIEQSSLHVPVGWLGLHELMHV